MVVRGISSFEVIVKRRHQPPLAAREFRGGDCNSIMLEIAFKHAFSNWEK